MPCFTKIEMKYKRIAIDGPASTGKTIIGAWLAKELKCFCYDTGLTFRAFTYYCCQKKVNFAQPSEIIKAFLTFQFSLNSHNKIVINDQIIDNDCLVQPIITDYINYVTVLPEVRAGIASIHKRIAQNNIVMVGRDIGTVIIPDAEVKIFMTANLKIRAQRRVAQNKLRGINTPYKVIYDKIKKRDFVDQTRKIGVLKPAKDAIILDNSSLTLHDNKVLALKIVSEKIKGCKSG